MRAKKEEIMDLSLKYTNGSSQFTTVTITTSHNRSSPPIIKDIELIRLVEWMSLHGWATVEEEYKPRQGVVVNAISRAVARLKKHS